MDRAATELFGAASGCETATAPVKLVVGLLGAGGQLFAKMYFPSGVTVSTPAVSGHLPRLALAIVTVAGSNCGRPSHGTEIFMVLSHSPTSKKEGES
jgi:hypothetical protein